MTSTLTNTTNASANMTIGKDLTVEDIELLEGAIDSHIYLPIPSEFMKVVLKTTLTNEEIDTKNIAQDAVKICESRRVMFTILRAKLAIMKSELRAKDITEGLYK